MKIRAALAFTSLLVIAPVHAHAQKAGEQCTGTVFVAQPVDTGVGLPSAPSSEDPALATYRKALLKIRVALCPTMPVIPVEEFADQCIAWSKKGDK